MCPTGSFGFVRLFCIILHLSDNAGIDDPVTRKPISRIIVHEDHQTLRQAAWMIRSIIVGSCRSSINFYCPAYQRIGTKIYTNVLRMIISSSRTNADPFAYSKPAYTKYSHHLP